MLIWLLVREVLSTPQPLLDFAPDQAACLGDLPQPATFVDAGALVFWSAFGIEIAYYAAVLAILPAFTPDYALDIPVIGVGVLLIAMAAALRMAVDLHDDAQLTI